MDSLFWRWYIEFALLLVGLTAGGIAVCWSWLSSLGMVESYLASSGIALAAIVLSSVVSVHRFDRRLEKW